MRLHPKMIDFIDVQNNRYKLHLHRKEERAILEYEGMRKIPIILYYKYCLNGHRLLLGNRQEKDILARKEDKNHSISECYLINWHKLLFLRGRKEGSKQKMV